MALSDPVTTPPLPDAARSRIEAAIAAAEDRLELLAVLRPIWTRRWPVLGATVATALIFLIVTLMQGKTYAAVATVMLDPREQKVVAAQDEVVSDLKLNTPILESEVAVIRSSDLLNVAVRRIGPDRFAALGTARPDAAQAADPDDADRQVAGIVRVLRRGMDVRRVTDSYVIEIGFTTPDPALSALVANTLADVYIAHQLADRQRVADAATRWIAQQVDARRSEVAEAEAAVEAFKQTQLSRSGSTIEVLEQQVAELNQQLVLTRSDRATEQARLDQIDRLSATGGPIAAAESQASAQIQTLRQARAMVLRDDARMAASLGPNHPDRQRLATELHQIDGAIVDEVKVIAAAHRGEIGVLDRRAAALSGAVGEIEGRIAAMATASLRLRQLEREAEAVRGTLQDLLARLGDTHAQAEIQRAEARIVSRAQVPDVAATPRPKLMTAFGATLGLTVALVAALAMDLVSSGYTNAAELERGTGLPVLASIPSDAIDRPAAVLDRLRGAPASLLPERIRQIRALLDPGAPGDRAHCILLLSSVPDEGKTTTSVALARSWATSGRRTVLVDLDTRRPALLTTLAGEVLFDLENYLDGSARISDAVAPVPGESFCVTGLRAPVEGMADRITGAALTTLVADLGASFDVIVLDAPPVLAVSDGLNFARIVDSLLYLVRFRRTSRRSVSYGLAGLRHAGLEPTGLVMTRVDIDSDPDLYARDYVYGAGVQDYRL